MRNIHSQEITEALIAAYPSPKAWDGLLQRVFNEGLSAFTSWSWQINLNYMVLNVMTRVRYRYAEVRFFEACLKENPCDEKLRTAVQSFLTDEPPPPAWPPQAPTLWGRYLDDPAF